MEISQVYCEQKINSLFLFMHIIKILANLSAFISSASTANGKHINKVELSVCKAGGTQIEYCRITLEDVLITNAIFNGTTHTDLIGMAYQFQAAKVQTQYWEQSASGGKGAESQSSWNIKENRE